MCSMRVLRVAKIKNNTRIDVRLGQNIWIERYKCEIK